MITSRRVRILADSDNTFLAAQSFNRRIECLGTHIEVKPDGSDRMFCRITVPALGGGWCLMCGNIINLQRAAWECAPP